MRILTRSILIYFLFFLNACNSNDDDNVRPTQVSNSQQILVVNEGNFGQGNASLSLIEEGKLVISNDLIAEANNGITTGDVVQSVYYSNGLIYIVSNVENRILVINSKTFQQVDVIESNLENPRYINITRGKIFVTNWGSDFVNSFVSVFSESDLSFNYKISTDPGTEKIFTNDGQEFWVSNNFSNTIQVFEFGKNEIKETIQVGYAPNGINSLQADELFVLCQDTFGGSNGYIYKIGIEGYQKLDSVQLGIKPGDQLEFNSISSKGGFLFYGGTSVFTFDPSNRFSISENKLADFSSELGSIYGIGIDNSGDLWIADHLDFTRSGRVVKTNGNNPGKIVESYSVGIGPNGFLFKY
ncbi:hypothetical protein HZR84_12770 [Hyphobacterium sp. CCMP332]|nr:hypothetical protein HZR84_12770 [Hyphobacterium sp. CCMP332]